MAVDEARRLMVVGVALRISPSSNPDVDVLPDLQVQMRDIHAAIVAN